jgi:hypothetical protein
MTVQWLSNQLTESQLARYCRLSHELASPRAEPTDGSSMQASEISTVDPAEAQFKRLGDVARRSTPPKKKTVSRPSSVGATQGSVEDESGNPPDGEVNVNSSFSSADTGGIWSDGRGESVTPPTEISESD